MDTVGKKGTLRQFQTAQTAPTVILAQCVTPECYNQCGLSSSQYLPTFQLREDAIEMQIARKIEIPL